MNRDIISLTSLPINQKGILENLTCDGEIRRRLLDLGLVSGSSITPVLSSPSGGLRAFDIRGSLIAIRDEDAYSIFVSL